MSINKNIVAFFTESGTPKTGLTPTVRIWDVGEEDLVVEDSPMSELGDGFYFFDFEAYNEEKDYAVRCDAGATLSGADRYTFAGNESYIDDIWGAQTVNHRIVGSFGEALVQAGGTVVSGGGGTARPLTQKEMEDLAKMVWEVIMDNNQKAGEVLLSRSDFDHRKDAVVLKDDIVGKIVSELNPVKDMVSEVLSSQDKLDLIDDVIKQIQKASMAISLLGDKTDKIKLISPQIKAETEQIVNTIKSLTKQVEEQQRKSIEVGESLVETVKESSAKEIISALDQHKQEKEEAMEKLNEAIKKMTTATNSLVDIWGKLAFNKILNNSALRSRLRR
jgi:hypothetical protein